MIVGYARTSTVDQEAGFEAQLRDLAAAGCERIFQEQISSVAKRAQLEEALMWCREGDSLVVTKLDRLARSVGDLCRIVERLERSKVSLRILAIGLDTTTPTGRLVLQLLGAIAEFERSIMLERQREGIAKAKAEGRFTGRQPTARRQSADVLRLKGEGKGASEIARMLGIGRASVYRILEDAA